MERKILIFSLQYVIVKHFMFLSKCFSSLAAKPIDLLAEYVNPEEDDFELQMNEPYSVLVVCFFFR